MTRLKKLTRCKDAFLSISKKLKSFLLSKIRKIPMEKQYVLALKPLHSNGYDPEKYFWMYWEVGKVKEAKFGAIKLDLSKVNNPPLIRSKQIPESQLILLKLTYGIP
jgi:hypothetical protein